MFCLGKTMLYLKQLWYTKKNNVMDIA